LRPPRPARARAPLAAVLGVGLLLCACRGADEPGLLLGVIADLSGPGSPAGRDLRDGARLALRPARPALRALVQDDAGDPRRAARLARYLRDLDGVVAILAPVSPAAAREVLAVLDGGAPVPVLLPGPCPPELTAGRPWAFCLQPSADYFGEALAWFLVTRLGVDEAGIVLVDDASDRALAEGFSRELERLGGRVLFRREVGPAEGAPSAADSVPATLLAGVDAATHARAPDGTGRSGAAPILLAGPWLPSAETPAPPDDDARAGGGGDGRPAAGVLRPILFDPDETPRTRAFARAFEDAFGRAPGAAAALAYEGVSLVARAVGDGADTPAAVRERLASPQRGDAHEGLAGSFFFSLQGHAIREIAIGTAEGGVAHDGGRAADGAPPDRR
jgi:ABC-type branched-subunit amino acid transport system substrate-binding protein